MIINKIQPQIFKGIAPKKDIPHNSYNYDGAEKNYESEFYTNYRPYSINKTAILPHSAKEVQNLYEITKDEEKSKDFFDEILSNPRQSKELTRALRSKAGGIEPFTKWYFAKDGYKKAYENYARNIYENAKSPDDLLQLSPNWTCWAFEDKFGKDFSFGEIPQDIGTKEDYQKLVKSVLNNEPNSNVKELGGGLSGKRAFLITTDDKKYVLKVQNDYLEYSDALKKALKEDPWLEDSFFKNYKDNENMKSDSCFLNAMIDRYLNLNNCENAPKMHYFDADTSSVLYEFTEGENFEDELNILNINDTLKDINDLSIVYNDISTDNLKVDNGKIRIIDSGESNFINVLKPTVPGLQFELPNWSGNGIASFQAGMFASST